MPHKKRTRAASSDATDVTQQSDQSNNKRVNKVAIRPARGVLTRGKQHGISIIRPSNQTIDFLLMYPFVLPLVVLMLSDVDVLTSLLVTCKTIKVVIKHYEIKLSIPHEIAIKLLDVNRYLPSLVTAIHDVSDVNSLASFSSLAQVEFDSTLEYLQLALLPRSIKQLTLPSFFDQSINPGDLPDGLETLLSGLDSWFNHPFQHGSLPSSLKSLMFDHESIFNQPIPPGILPSSLTSLKLGDQFNQHLDVGCLPDSLITLDLGRQWNRPLTPGVIPQTVTRLVFGENFNQPLVPHALPSSLTDLTLGDRFNQTLEHIPSSITHLKLLYCRKPPIIPNFITHLFTSSSLNIPHSVTHLVLYCRTLSPGSIPDSVTHLRFDEHFDSEVLPGVIPNSVINLRFGSCFNQNISPRSIPSSVVRLRLGSSFNQIIKPGTLPDSLVDLTFGDAFNRSLGHGVLPPSLKTITLPVNHNKRINLGSSDCSLIYADLDDEDDVWCF